MKLSGRGHRLVWGLAQPVFAEDELVELAAALSPVASGLNILICCFPTSYVNLFKPEHPAGNFKR